MSRRSFSRKEMPSKKRGNDLSFLVNPVVEGIKKTLLEKKTQVAAETALPESPPSAKKGALEKPMDSVAKLKERWEAAERKTPLLKKRTRSPERTSHRHASDEDYEEENEENEENDGNYENDYDYDYDDDC